MKKVTAYVKLQIKAGQANPAPPIGPALGSKGVNIMEFCKQFNASTQGLEPGMPIPTVITVYADRSFTFVTKSPPVSFFVKRAAKLDKGSATPSRTRAGTITMDQVREIAQAKMGDLNANDVETAMTMIVGSARSMGIEVQE